MCSGVWPGGMHDRRSDIAELEDLAVLDGMEREIGSLAFE